MTFLPIVERDLRRAARRGSTYWSRVILGATAVVVVTMTMALQLFAASRVMLGGAVFYGLSFTILLLCCGAGLFVTADALSEEKREQTLGLLFLTDLKGYDVVFGKLVSTSLTSISGLLSILPVLGIVLLMGGVSPGEFWRMTLVFLSTLFFSLTSGLFASSLSQSENQSRLRSFGLILLIGAAFPLLEAILRPAGVRGLSMLAAASPLTAWRMAFDLPYRMGSYRYWDSIIATGVVGWGLAILASWILPRRLQEETPVAAPQTRESRVEEADLETRVRRRRRLLEVNPVLWMVARRSGPAWVSSVICLLLVLLAVAGLWIDSSISMSLISTCALGLSLLTRISVALQSSRFFSEARRSGALEMLLSTPLSARGILSGQWLAIRRYYLLPVIAILCLRILALISAIQFARAGDAVTGNGMMSLWMYGGQVYEMIRLVTDVFAVAWMGMLTGLMCRKPGHAPGLTILFAIVLPALAACIPNIVIDIILIFWARDKLGRELGLRCRTDGALSRAPVAPVMGSPSPSR